MSFISVQISRWRGLAAAMLLFLFVGAMPCNCQEQQPGVAEPECTIGCEPELIARHIEEARELQKRVDNWISDQHRKQAKSDAKMAALVANMTGAVNSNATDQGFRLSAFLNGISHARRLQLFRELTASAAEEHADRYFDILDTAKPFLDENTKIFTPARPGVSIEPKIRFGLIVTGVLIGVFACMTFDALRAGGWESRPA
jgi:hypothetical protein